jgi:chloramphenicol O-acetyltransferase type A
MKPTHPPPVVQWLDLAAWPRRATFEYFRHFDKPYFSICTRLDVARLQDRLRSGRGEGINLAVHHVALRLANEQAPFRYRIDGDGVRVLPVVHGSLPVLRDDESLAFAHIEYQAGFAAFAQAARAAIDGARQPDRVLGPLDDERDLMHFTTLPWINFTSFEHARNWGRDDSVPKVAFGRITPDGPHRWLPMALEVHHGLMDGLHVGRYVQGFEAALAEPEAWLGLEA